MRRKLLLTITVILSLIFPTVTFGGPGDIVQEGVTAESITSVTFTALAASGNAVCTSLFADDAEDDADKWQYCVADNGNATLESKATGSWVAVWTITNAGAFTLPGSLTANGAILDGGSNTFSLTNGTASLDVAAGSTVDINQSMSINGAAFDVALSSPATDETLVYDGTKFVNGSMVTSGAGPGVLFYMDDTSIIGTNGNNDNEVNSLTKVPDGSGEVQDDISCTVGTSPVQGESFLYDTALGGTALDAGEWLTDTYAAVNSTTASRVSSITRNIYHVDVEGTETIETTGSGTSRTATASGGTPFVAGDANAVNVDAGYLQTPQGLYQITGFTNGTTVTIETPSGYTNENGGGVAFSVWKNLMSISTGTITSIDPAFALYQGLSVEAVVSISTTDKLAETVFAVCNNTTTVSYTHNGTARFSHFHSPLVTRHNDLEGLDEGDFQHMTAAENTGTGTGVFVRKDAPTLTGETIMGNIASVNYRTMWISAFDMYSIATNGATYGTSEKTTNDINSAYFAYDGTTEEFTAFERPFPEEWNLGTIKVKFFWSSATSSTSGDTVEWELQCGAQSDNDAIDAALGTGQVITDTLLADNGDDRQLSSATPSLTIGGTPALADMIHCKVSRNVSGGDNMSEDAWLYGMWIQYQEVATAVAAW